MDVAKEFNKADAGRVDLQKVAKPKTDHGKSKLFKKGGIMAKSDMKEDMKMDKAQDKAMIKKAFKQHDAQEHKGGKGTKLALKKGGMARMASKGEHSVQKSSKRGAEMVKMARGGGVETKGKTKGTMIKMCGGGMKGKK